MGESDDANDADDAGHADDAGNTDDADDAGHTDDANDADDAMSVDGSGDTDGIDRRQKLRNLQVAVRELVRADSTDDIAQVTVDTARDVLDCPLTGLWLYDAESDRLVPAAVTAEGRQSLGDPVSFDRGEGLAWKAFESGEIGAYEDVSTVEGVFNPETAVRSEINVPVGRYGVITTATRRRAAFDETDVDLLDILAANTEAVLDRTAQERELERYREMVESARNPIWAVDTDGRFTHVNERLVELADRSREALLGAHSSTVFGRDVVDRTTDLVGDLLASGETSTIFEESVLLPGGETREYLTSLSLLWDDGDYDGVVYVAHDVTELRQNERRLSVFNRVLRHNLRNQLNIIIGHVEDLATGGDESGAEHAERALDAARNLLALSEKARRFQDSDPGRTAEIEPTDVAALATRVVDRARDRFPAATIRSDLPDEAWARAHEGLGLAFEELVANGVRHNDGDPFVDVTVSVLESNRVEVQVADNGPGIPEMERRSFERGLETPLDHASGLGLAMVRWTVTNSGGSIAIEENDPRGTVVVLRLPRASPSSG